MMCRMRLICYGISFHETTLSEREPMVFTASQQRHILRAIHREPQIHEGLALCTCNRTELYLYTEAAVDTEAFVRRLIAELNPKGLDVWRHHHYIYEGIAAVEHLFRVAAGLDSQMLGENQILRQVKDAYSASIEEGTSRFFLHRLLHCTFRAAKSVRTRTDINTGAVSISAAAVELAAEQVHLPGATVILVGAGENAALAATHLVKRGIGQLQVISRTLDSAAELCARLKTGRPHTLEALPELAGRADLILCSTASEKPVLTAADYAYLFSQRTEPVVIVDIAVPRDVDPELAQIDGVRLFNIEDLDRQVQTNLQRRGAQIPEAERLIADHVQRYHQWLDSLNIKDVVSELVRTYRALARSEVQRYGGQFDPAQREVLERFAVSLVKKVLHGPICYLKQSAQDERVWDQLQAAELIRKMLLETERKGRS
ncbi:MAG TPA: glutamyl-tRNA reductase [Phycisphaerales bacterium]|nr:glutamyl-tRNA reductase [Phycisphaerales bacterium]